MQYQPGVLGDAPMLHWYCTLAANGDLQKLMGPSLHPLAAFLKNFTGPECALWYEEDGEGWWIVAWCFPLMGGGTWGLWVRPDKRASGSREAIRFIMATLQVSLMVFPVLVNTTKQRDVVDKTVRLGYKYLGEIPYLFEGEPCHVLYMTREMFVPLLERWSEYDGKR